MVPTRQEKQVGRPDAEGFEAVFVAKDGVEQRVPWTFMPDVVAELGHPVRSFPSYRGQRNYPGWYWSATMGARIRVLRAVRPTRAQPGALPRNSPLQVRNDDDQPLEENAMNAPGANDPERTRDETIDTGQPVARFAGSGERIGADEIYVVTPNGNHSRTTERMEYMFIQPEHLWRSDWLPDAAGFIRLVRDDHHAGLSYDWTWPTAAGLLGVCAYPIHGEFRTVRPQELWAAAANVVNQMSNHRPPPATLVTVSVPSGYTVHIVQPDLVYGTLREHRRVALGLDSDPGA
jgi:hypothetical protein